jgi:hypothetical protein
MKKIFLLVVLLISITICNAQNDWKYISYNLDFGPINGMRSQEFTLVFEQEIYFKGTDWFSIVFDRINLGKNSYIKITSTKDNDSQKITSYTNLEAWKNHTGYFNGDRVILELFAHRDDTGIGFSIKRVHSGKFNRDVNFLSSCNDDRVKETDNKRKWAIGRIHTNGTAWLSNTGIKGKLVTAKHVFKQYNDSQASAEPLPNIYELDVPESDAYGTPQLAAINNQWPIRGIVKESSFDFDNGVSYGDDWAIFEVFYNGIDYSPYQYEGFAIEQNYNTTNTYRISGFGRDTELKKSQTLQTSTGNILDYTSNTNILEYNIYSTGGSSGSPIINESNGKVIGIVTGGGPCETGSFGTSFLKPEIWEALEGNKKYVKVTQVDESSTQIGNFIYHYENNVFKEKNNGIKIGVILNSNLVVRSEQLIHNNRKFNFWNATNSVTNHNSFLVDENFTTDLKSIFTQISSDVIIKNSFENVANINPSNDYIKFKDPWYIDFEDPNFSNNRRNRGIDAPFIARESPFNPNVTTVFSESPVPYQGVFLKQGYNENTNIWSEPYYSIAATSQMISINGFDRYFYFQNWEVENPGSAVFQYPNHAQTPVVFNQPDAVIKAVMKSPQLSNDANGFNGNHQRKTVRTDDGFLHMVYESMGKVWYEYSRDNGQSWILGNSYKSLNNGLSAKNPSIDFIEDNIVITYVSLEAYNSIKLEIFSKNVNNYSYRNSYTLFQHGELNNNYIAPIVALSYGRVLTPILNSKLLLIFDYPNDVLAYKTADFDLINKTILNISDIEALPNTSINSISPALVSYKVNTSSKYYHLAYKDGAAVKYKRIVLNGSTLSVDRETTISTGSGFTNNYNPSITILSDNSPVVSWVGYRTLIDERLEKANAGTYEERIVLRRGYSSGSWSSTFYKYDNGVNTPSIVSSGSSYAIGWSLESNNQNRFARSDYLLQAGSSSVYGKDVQLINNSTLSSIRYSTLQTASTPYAFTNQQIPDTQPAKLSSLAIANGREGIVTKGEAGFYYLIGDVVLDQTTINFTELTDETTISNETELNSYLTTEEFTVNNNSDLTFSVRFGTVDSVTTANTLNDNEYVRFRVELVDAATNELLGTFSSVEYTKTNLYQYNNIGYSVNTDGIGNKKVKIRLRVEDNVEAEYTIAQIIADETVLGKTNYTEISYLGELSVETYELAQNYPNPFNPETVIYYQIPESGEVSLKVYDMLGRELRTLVNQTQNQGRYEVKFNARDLASGVYIYRLQVNDFVTSKKMMLVK